jgi:hypothetical protein
MRTKRTCLGHQGFVCSKVFVIKGKANNKLRCRSCAIKRNDEREREWKSAHLEQYRNKCKKWRKNNPERVSVANHWFYIFGSGNPSYAGMPFFDGWNPEKGGSFGEGARWIVSALGKRPQGCSLHIVRHDLGFVPGNLVWSEPSEQSHQQLRKIAARQRLEILSLKEQLATAYASAGGD